MNYKHKRSNIKMKVLNPELQGRKHSGIFICEIIDSENFTFISNQLPFKVSKEMLNKDWIKED